MADKLGIKSEPGWANPFTRNDAPQARWRVGARVRKVLQELGDMTPLGTLGTVLGSLYAPEVGAAYFVEWDCKPRVAVLVVEAKITADRRDDL